MPSSTLAKLLSKTKPSSTSKMAASLTHPKITPRRSSDRGHADHGWLNTYHTFSFSSYYSPSFQSFGSLRVLNEDRVAGGSGFPTHPHRDFEIFSYVLSGELTHRDSMMKKGEEGVQQGDQWYRMKRGDVQFTTGGTGIAHSEQNESAHPVHFLQIWALPWKRGLTPRYHTKSFSEDAKRTAFLPILSPLKAGQDASAQEEERAEPVLPDTIPIHADFVMAAGIIGAGERFQWVVGGEATREEERRVYIHVPMTQEGKSRVKLDVNRNGNGNGNAGGKGKEEIVLEEGDGAFVEGVKRGDVLGVQSVGEVEAEVVVLDSD